MYCTPFIRTNFQKTRDLIVTSGFYVEKHYTQFFFKSMWSKSNLKQQRGNFKSFTQGNIKLNQSEEARQQSGNSHDSKHLSGLKRGKMCFINKNAFVNLAAVGRAYLTHNGAKTFMQPQSILDAVGSWQKILPMPNLERAY